MEKSARSLHPPGVRAEMAKKSPKLPPHITPHPSQAHLPLKEVTRWRIARTIRRANGELIRIPGTRKPRVFKWQCTGTLQEAQALHDRRVAEVLEEGQLYRQANPKPAKVPPEAAAPPGTRTYTVKEYGEEHYLPYLKGKEPSTHANKASLLRNHIYPDWGHLTLPQLQLPETVKEIKAYLESPERHHSKRGLKKAASRNSVLSAMSGMLSHAADPSRAPGGRPLLKIKYKITEFPSDDKAKVSNRKDQDGFLRGANRHKRMSDEEARQLLQVARESKSPWHYAMVGLGLFCGLRISEIAGLRWEDVDLDGGQIYVGGQIDRITHQHKNRTKNRAKAWIRVDRGFLREIHERRANPEYVTGSTYRHHTGGKLAKDFAKLAVVAWGSAKYTTHAMRHTFGSRLADTGAPIHEIAEALRDSLAVAATYIHPSEDAGDRILASADSLRGVSQPSQPDPSPKEDHRDQLIAQLMAQNAELTSQITALNKMLSKLMEGQSSEAKTPHLQIVENK